MSIQSRDNSTLAAGACPRHQRYVLWPHRSLTARSAFVLMTILAVGLAAPVVVISGVGAWPLVITAVATFAGVIFALRRNNKAAEFHEVIEVSPQVVQIDRIGPASDHRHIEFSPHWVQVVVETDHYLENRLTLRESGRRYSVGEFLAPEERQSLAEMLSEGLRSLRSA